MTAVYYFVREQLLNAETCLTYLSHMREHQVKPSIDKKNHTLLQLTHKTTVEVRYQKHAGSTDHDQL